MRRGAAGRDLRPSDAPILVLSSTPPPYPSRESATLALHGDRKRCALGGAGRKIFSGARGPGSRSRCAAETQHVHVARPRPQQLWSAEEVRSVCCELPLLGSNQDSPDPEASRAGLFGG